MFVVLEMCCLWVSQQNNKTNQTFSYSTLFVVWFWVHVNTVCQNEITARHGGLCLFSPPAVQNELNELKITNYVLEGYNAKQGQKFHNEQSFIKLKLLISSLLSRFFPSFFHLNLLINFLSTVACPAQAKNKQT